MIGTDAGHRAGRVTSLGGGRSRKGKGPRAGTRNGEAKQVDLKHPGKGLSTQKSGNISVKPMERHQGPKLPLSAQSCWCGNWGGGGGVTGTGLDVRGRWEVRSPDCLDRGFSTTSECRPNARAFVRLLASRMTAQQSETRVTAALEIWPLTPHFSSHVCHHILSTHHLLCLTLECVMILSAPDFPHLTVAGMVFADPHTTCCLSGSEQLPSDSLRPSFLSSAAQWTSPPGVLLAPPPRHTSKRSHHLLLPNLLSVCMGQRGVTWQKTHGQVPLDDHPPAITWSSQKPQLKVSSEVRAEAGVWSHQPLSCPEIMILSSFALAR